MVPACAAGYTPWIVRRGEERGAMRAYCLVMLAALFANIIKNVAYNIWNLTPTSRWNKSQKPM